MDQSSPKWEKTWRTPRSTIIQSFTALCPPTPEICVTKILWTNKQTNKQTVNDISTTCLKSGLLWQPAKKWIRAIVQLLWPAGAINLSNLTHFRNCKETEMQIPSIYCNTLMENFTSCIIQCKHHTVYRDKLSEHSTYLL